MVRRYVKLPLASLVFVLGVGVLCAQGHPGDHGAPPFTSVGGWGSVAFPGVGHPPQSGYVNTSRHYGGGGWQTGVARGGGYRQTPAYTYAYPVYVGYPEAAYPAAPAPEPAPYPAYGTAMGAPPAPTTVIINQNFAAPVETPPPTETVRVYNDPRRSADNPVPDPQYYLIALKDHSVYSAVAYWVEDGTLHYITTPNIRNQTSLDLVDMALTARLNQDRGVTVSLPPAR